MAKSKNPEQTTDGKYRGVVYCRTHKGSGKSYVGETDNEKLRMRSWDNKGSKSYGGTKIMEARKQYGIGPDIWDYKVLEEIILDSHDELVKSLHTQQTFWIKEKNSVENGFNSSYGDGMQGMKHSDQSRKKISKNHRTYQAEATKIKLSLIMEGRKVSQETREKISAGNRGKKRSLEQRQAESTRLKGKVPQAATNGAKAWVKQNGGGYWKNHKLSEEAKRNMKAAQQKRGQRIQVQYPDGHTENFNTMLDAANNTGHLVGSVYYSAQTGSVTRRNFKFSRL